MFFTSAKVSSQVAPNFCPEPSSDGGKGLMSRKAAHRGWSRQEFCTCTHLPGLTRQLNYAYNLHVKSLQLPFVQSTTLCFLLEGQSQNSHWIHVQRKSRVMFVFWQSVITVLVRLFKKNPNWILLYLEKKVLFSGTWGNNIFNWKQRMQNTYKHIFKVHFDKFDLEMRARCLSVCLIKGIWHFGMPADWKKQDTCSSDRQSTGYIRGLCEELFTSLVYIGLSTRKQTLWCQVLKRWPDWYQVRCVFYVNFARNSLSKTGLHQHCQRSPHRYQWCQCLFQQLCWRSARRADIGCQSCLPVESLSKLDAFLARWQQKQTSFEAVFSIDRWPSVWPYGISEVGRKLVDTSNNSSNGWSRPTITRKHSATFVASDVNISDFHMVSRFISLWTRNRFVSVNPFPKVKTVNWQPSHFAQISWSTVFGHNEISCQKLGKCTHSDPNKSIRLEKKITHKFCTWENVDNRNTSCWSHFVGTTWAAFFLSR